jgi:hypothetical protein
VVPGIGLACGEFQRDDMLDRYEETARSIEALQRRSGNPDPVHSVHRPPPLHDIDALIRENYRPVRGRR